MLFQLFKPLLVTRAARVQAIGGVEHVTLGHKRVTFLGLEQAHIAQLVCCRHLLHSSV